MRWIVGFLLIAAAVLKAVQIFNYPATVLVDSHSRFLLPILIGCELGLGLSAIAGLLWRQLRLVAMALFAGFASYSLLLVLNGATSCGCFGPLEIHPWWMFFLDFIVFGGLLLEYLTKRKAENTANDSTKVGICAGVACNAMISVAVAIGLSWHIASQHTISRSGFQLVGDLTILEPETWVGKTFPLLGHINMDISEGNWVLLLHRHDCPDCQRALPLYKELADYQREMRVAIIEVPPFSAEQAESSGSCIAGRLKDDREWFVRTPIEIQLENGVVSGVFTKVPSASFRSVTEPMVYSGETMPSL